MYSYDIISKEDIPEKIRGQLEIAIKEPIHTIWLFILSPSTVWIILSVDLLNSLSLFQ